VSVYDKLREIGVSLPPVTPSVALFLPFVRTGNMIFVSGHIARRNGEPWVGRLGAELTVADGREAARGIAIELLGALHAATADLNSVTRIVKLLVLVNGEPTFTEPHLVANGASELLSEVFGDRGPHARTAIGVAQLPLGACVEIELIAEVGSQDRERQC
jgi:enamine deaminase RidA (YjgF/YER057c/UK114 family)